MSLAIDARMVAHSGIGTYVSNVLPRLIAMHSAERIHLIGRRAQLEERAWTRSAHVSLVECGSAIFSLAEQLQLPRVIPADCALFWSPQFNIPLAYRGRLLVTVQDILHIAMPQYAGGWHRHLYARALLAAIARKAEAVICTSRFTAQELVRLAGIKESKIVVTHLGVDESWFTVDRASRPHPRPYFVFVGNVKRHKNLRGLVDAFASLMGQVPHDLVIVGQKQGMLTADRLIESRAQALGERVRFTGLIDDALLRKYVAGAEALVLPSFYEGFGLPPLEAMACGTPAVVAARASLPEVCGDAALYCEPDDIADIAAKLLQVASSEETRARLREKGLVRARQFTWDKCARETLAVIRRLTG